MVRGVFCIEVVGTFSRRRGRLVIEFWQLRGFFVLVIDRSYWLFTLFAIILGSCSNFLSCIGHLLGAIEDL